MMLLALLACGSPPGSSPGDSALYLDTRTDPTVVPNFELTDLNPNSARAGETVSPRDYLTRVSGWYFTEAT